VIASRSRNFVFIKTRKTGSTSLEIVLSSWCSARDICTPISAEDEPMREQFGGRVRNHLDWRGKERFYNHMPAEEVSRKLPSLWRNAFTFAVERHPYEKVVSLAWYRLAWHGLPPDQIGAQIAAVITDREYLNAPLYAPGGRLLVREVWEYSEAWHRLRLLAERLGTAMPSEVPTAKSRFRRDQRPAKEILTLAQQAAVYEVARFEFDLMGYER
jgi:hypothetical protein